MKIRDDARQLFMKYALPCAGTLVRRGVMKQEGVDKLIEIVKRGEKIPDGAENHFKVAMAACSLIALDSGKKEIDEETLHEYYLFEHDKIIDRRYAEMMDFDAEACRIRSGIVKSVSKGFAIVENSSCAGKYRADYCDARTGDLVVTHWDFIVEHIDAKTAEKMKQQKIMMKLK